MRMLLLLASVALLAFAPAPFPRRERGPKPAGCSLEDLRGSWRVASLATTVRGGAPTKHDINQAIHVAGDQWTFETLGNRASSVSYAISIDTRAAPAQINWYSGKVVAGTPYGRGILRRRGDTVELLYSWGSERSANFENPPAGHWLMVLQRR